ncbi:mitotic-spindle organizing gamma-tubulin ring associated-domain-containing protein [Phyllosticta citrichinensis]|uniref:Mitotic-spindle organizing protein 1 n=1 Tax=Phyllosticta citrichinensis TaxID=1130410 RepID=A0ABR1XP80_9PEZI
MPVRGFWLGAGTTAAPPWWSALIPVLAHGPATRGASSLSNTIHPIASPSPSTSLSFNNAAAAAAIAHSPISPAAANSRPHPPQCITSATASKMPPQATTDADKRQAAREVVDILEEIATLLNTKLNRTQLSYCISLVENGVNPEALAVRVSLFPLPTFPPSLFIQASKHPNISTSGYLGRACPRAPSSATCARSTPSPLTRWGTTNINNSSSSSSSSREERGRRKVDSWRRNVGAIGTSRCVRLTGKLAGFWPAGSAVVKQVVGVVRFCWLFLASIDLRERPERREVVSWWRAEELEEKFSCCAGYLQLLHWRGRASRRYLRVRQSEGWMRAERHPRRWCRRRCIVLLLCMQSIPTAPSARTPACVGRR